VIDVAVAPAVGRATGVEGVEPHAGTAEADAVAGLYDRHRRRVFAFCLRQLGRPDEAEDAVQVTFLHALGALRRGVVPESESAWLLKIARNACLSRFDAARRRRTFELAQDPHVLAERAPGRLLDDRDRFRLDEALLQLTEPQRRAIVMREWQGLSYTEIGGELGLGPAAVEALIFRARRALAKELRSQDDEGRAWPLDLSSLLGWAKSLFGGGALKVAVGAVGAAAVATLGAVVAGPVVHSSQPSVGVGGATVPVRAAVAAPRPAPIRTASSTVGAKLSAPRAAARSQSVSARSTPAATRARVATAVPRSVTTSTAAPEQAPTTAVTAPVRAQPETAHSEPAVAAPSPAAPGTGEPAASTTRNGTAILPRRDTSEPKAVPAAAPPATSQAESTVQTATNAVKSLLPPVTVPAATVAVPPATVSAPTLTTPSVPLGPVTVPSVTTPALPSVTVSVPAVTTPPLPLVPDGEQTTTTTTTTTPETPGLPSATVSVPSGLPSLPDLPLPPNVTTTTGSGSLLP